MRLHRTIGSRTRRALKVLGWIVSLAFLAWALRLVALEGYVYELPGNFIGDFTRTAELEAPRWFTGTELFYGPLFVLEYRLLFATHLMSPGDFARLDFVLFGVAFACVWLALIGWRRPALMVFVLAAWLAHHMSVEAFANTAHLEILELAFMAIALLLAVRGQPFGAGTALGLSIATKTLPALFLPYLAITRKWRLLAAATVASGVLFVAACAIQGISLWDGFISLIYQGGNLTKLEYTEYEYAPRAEIARMLAGDGGSLTDAEAAIAVGIHAAIAVAALALVALVLMRTELSRAKYGLFFGLIGAVMLVVAPSVHPPYYIFLLPAWTAILAVLLEQPFKAATVTAWITLGVAYVFTGFDQVFFAMQRVFGVGIVVPQHWLSWHLPSIGLALTIVMLVTLLRRPVAEAATEMQAAIPVPAVAAPSVQRVGTNSV